MGHRFKSISVSLLALALTLLLVLPASADPPAYGPCGPGGIALNVINSSEIDLSWTAVTATPDVTGYRIERESPVGNGFGTIVSNTGSAGTSYADTGQGSGLSPNTQYSYRISAINASGTGPACPPGGANPVAATTLAAAAYIPPPGPPQNLTASAVSGSEIDISWTAPPSGSAITGYKIERDFSGGFTTLVPNTNSAGTSYVDTNLSPNVTYSYRLTAFNASGPSNPSRIAYATTPVPPSAPGSASATAGDGQASVMWSAAYASAGGVTGYVVSGTPNGSASVSSSTLTVIITGLTNGVSYSFSVRATNAAGQGAAATTNIVTPATSTPSLPPPPPSSPVVAPPPPSPPQQPLQDQLNSLMATLQALTLQAKQQGIISPTSAITTFVFSLQLTVGAKGNAVRELQKRLLKEGFYSGEITGYFGQLTRAAVKAYQRARGISTTGALGPLTRASLNATK